MFWWPWVNWKVGREVIIQTLVPFDLDCGQIQHGNTWRRAYFFGVSHAPSQRGMVPWPLPSTNFFGSRTTPKWFDLEWPHRRSFVICFYLNFNLSKWLGRWTCDQQVASLNPGLPTVKYNPGQVVNVPLSPSSIIWYQPMGGDARSVMWFSVITRVGKGRAMHPSGIQRSPNFWDPLSTFGVAGPRLWSFTDQPHLSLGQFRRALITHLFDCVCRA